MSLTAAITLVQAALALLTLAQTHPEVGQAVRDNALQASQQATVQATAALDAAAQTTPESSTSGSQSSNAPPLSSLINVQHTCPIVDPPASTTLTATRDSYNCAVEYSCG